MEVRTFCNLCRFLRVLQLCCSCLSAKASSGNSLAIVDVASSPSRCVSLHANRLDHTRSEEGEHSSEEPEVLPELPGLGLAHDAGRGVAVGAFALLPVGPQE